jgi:hypothetical protein
MTHKEFTFWLKGFLDGVKNNPSSEDIELIRSNLSGVRDENCGTYITTTPGLTFPYTTPLKPGL